MYSSIMSRWDGIDIFNSKYVRCFDVFNLSLIYKSLLLCGVFFSLSLRLKNDIGIK